MIPRLVPGIERGGTLSVAEEKEKKKKKKDWSWSILEIGCVKSNFAS